VGSVIIRFVKVRLIYRLSDCGDARGWVRSFIFFLLLYSYLWVGVDLRLVYHGGGVITDFPVFFRTWAFFCEFSSHPGGPVEYAAAFLAQLFYYSWAGALVVTLLAWFIFLCFGYFLRAVNAGRLCRVRFVPPILLLVIYSRYTYHFASIIALLAALSFACLYMRLARSGRQFRIAVFLGLSVILYYIAGGGFLLFGVLCAIFEMVSKQRWRAALLYVVLAAVIPYVEGVVIFGASIINAYTELLPFSWKTIGYESRKDMVEIVYALYLLAPLAAVAPELWRRFIARSPERPVPKARRKARGRRPGPLRRIVSFYRDRALFRWLVESAALFGVCIGVLFAAYDGERKAMFEIAYYDYHKMWPQLLDAARRHRRSARVSNAVNRALYHTGRLGYDMFSYPQHRKGFLLSSDEYRSAYLDRFETRIELGLVGMAENDLAESLGTFGRRPVILRGLALVNMVKGDMGSARVYLGALGKTLFHTEWANEYLDRLKSDPDLSTDKEIQRLRRLRLHKDHSAILSHNEEALATLLAENGKNRMAFEYLMSWRLLTKQLDKFVGNINLLNDLGYSEMPRLYEEAILAYVHTTGKDIHLEGDWGSPKARQRIDEFGRIFNRYGQNKEAAFGELAAKYGDSYFFYNVYGFCGVKN